MTEETLPPVMMGNDEYGLHKGLYDVIAAAQKRGVSLQMCLGHVTGLKLHLELTLLRTIRDGGERQDEPSRSAASDEGEL
jgi:hypothetical protein